MQMLKRFRGRAAGVLSLAAVFAMVVVGNAFATGPEYSIAPVAEKVTSELTANLPTILGIIGGLIALTIAVRAVRKFAKV